MEYVTYVIALDTNDMPMHAIVRSHSKDLSVSIVILFVKLSYDGQKILQYKFEFFPSFIDSYGLAEMFISGKWKSVRIFFQSTPNSMLCSVTCLQFNNGLSRTFLIFVVLRGSFLQQWNSSLFVELG